MGTSDFDGRFQIKPLVPGKYRVIAKCSGCKYSETTAIVLADKATPISLVIEQIKYNLVILEGINKNTAPEMIKNGVPIIFLFDSIKPKTCKENLVFEFIYHIRYENTWIAPVIDTIHYYPMRLCGTGMSDTKYLEYNNVIFKYLDKKYGKAWRQKVNQSAIGL